MTAPAAPADSAAPEAAGAEEATGTAAAAGAADTARPPATADPDAADVDNQHDREDQDDDSGNDKSKAARQAANYRVQLREARDSLVAATAALGVQQWAIVEATAVAAGFDPKLRTLMESSGVELDTLLTDDGLIDAEKVRDAIRTTAAAFGVQPKPRPPAPTPGQGRPPSESRTNGWSGVLGNAARGRG